MSTLTSASCTLYAEPETVELELRALSGYQNCISRYAVSFYARVTQAVWQVVGITLIKTV